MHTGRHPVSAAVPSGSPSSGLPDNWHPDIYAIALALRYGCPIYSTPEIIEKAGVVVVHTTDEQEEEDATIVKTIEVNNEMEEYSVQELTKMLEEAIQNEEYEKASKIRDMLREKNKSWGVMNN